VDLVPPDVAIEMVLPELKLVGVNANVPPSGCVLFYYYGCKGAVLKCIGDSLTRFWAEALKKYFVIAKNFFYL